MCGGELAGIECNKNSEILCCWKKDKEPSQLWSNPFFDSPYMRRLPACFKIIFSCISIHSQKTEQNFYILIKKMIYVKLLPIILLAIIRNIFEDEIVFVRK